jgi:predicted  nucleic acid-binding Zn-ribbon protein
MSHAPSDSSDSGAIDNDALSLQFLHRQIVFQEPERAVHPPSWLDYTPFAFWIVDALRPSIFVELGCHSGNSYASFAQAVQTLGLSTACYGVDTWRGDRHSGFFDESVFEDWSAYHDRRFSRFSRLIRATFDEAVEQFSSGSIDLLHMDGYHTFEAVSHDFETWRPKLSDRGVVLSHDINVRERDFGAWRLWERLRDEYPCFEFLHGHGLGVLGIGHNLPEAVRWLLSLRSHNPESVNTVRLFFSCLGAGVLGRYTAAEVQRTLRSELAARDDRLAHVTRDVAKLSGELAESERHVAVVQADLSRLSDAVRTAEEALATRIAEAERLASSLGSRDAQLAERAHEATRLESEITSLHERVSTLSSDLDERDERLAHATGNVARLSGELAESERGLAAAKADVMQLSDALGAAEESLVSRTAEAERLAFRLGLREAQLAEQAHKTARLRAQILDLRERVSQLSIDLGSRDTQVERLKLELDASARALSAGDKMVRKLDSEAAAVLERLQAETNRLREETTRRRRLEAVLCWSQAQVSSLSYGGPPGRTRTPGTLTSVSRGFAAVLRSAGHRPGALAQGLRIAAVPARFRDFLVIEASGLFDEAYYLERNPDLSATGIPALVHFVLAAGWEGCNPHLLFDSAWYLSRNPEVAEYRTNPLVHFIMVGAAEGRDPHPLFSTAFYVSQVPDLAARSQNALQHYLTQGWRTGCAPHPVFDPAYYLAQNPDVAREGGDPLSHYLEHGAAARRSPHPLFDIDFYLRENPDVLDAGIEPLTHFLVKGAREGKNPSAAFNVQDYLARHPDVRASGENPLVHYLLCGQAQGRQPIPAQDRQGRERLNDTSRVELTACSLAPQQDSPPAILVVSHVGPWRPRAGNEYRVHRMLRWYQQQGYRIIPLIAPLPGEELSREGIEGTAAAFGNIIQVHRDGRIEHILRDLPDVVASLDGTFTPSFADLLEEDAGASPRERELLKIERTFCHDAVISTVLHLQRSLGPHILQVEYIWMTRLLPLVRGNVLKVIDTHDVFSSIEQKVRGFGVRDVVIDPHEEAERLRRADLVLAIQDDERAQLKRLAPTVPVITAGVDFDVVDDGRVPTEGQILYVASSNARNCKGLDDFLRLAWPRIHHLVPHAELVVVGGVAKAIAGRDVSGVQVVGPVNDLTAQYQDAALVINPVVAGTGLKIKILEALCHLRPVVTWPAGVEGLDPKLAALCLVARDWYEFSEQVIGVLTRASSGGFTAGDRAVIAELVAPEHVYASLDSAYRAFFEQHRPTTEPIGLTRQVCGSPMVAHACD